MKANEKGMIVGMYFAQFEKNALNVLGFKNFNEAFNVIGILIDVKSSSLRNYRDEFAPAFPTKRKGWHKREMLPTRLDILDRFSQLNFNDFTKLIKNIIYENDPDLLFIDNLESDLENTSLSRRLLTGEAAEKYFLQNYSQVDFFQNGILIDTTKYGCGFDFKINFSDNSFYAVEVKGLYEKNGNILLTEKEYRVAEKLGENYFLFIIKNFASTPEYTIIRNPIKNIDIKMIKQNIVQISYTGYIK